MKRFIAAFLGVGLIGTCAYGQGTVSFKNYFGNASTDPAVWYANFTGKVQGSQYVVALLAGPSSGSEAQIATTTFLTQAGAAGFFQAGTVTIPTGAGGSTAFITIAAWDTTLNGTTTGATYAQAQAYAAANPAVQNILGLSTEFSVVTGNPNGNPPTTPAFLVPGLTSFSLSTPVPEPSLVALAGLGLTTLLLCRRGR